MRPVMTFAVVVSLSLSAPAWSQAKPTAKPPAAAKPGAAKPPAAKKPTKAEEEAAAAAAEEPRKAEAAAKRAAEAKAAEEAAAAAAKAAEEAAAQRAAEEAAAAAKAARAKQAEARGLDARTRALAEALAIPMKRLPGDHRDQRFAVIAFENVGEEAQQKSLGLVVSDLIVTDLARDHRLPMIERAQLAAVMNELALQQSGAVDEAKAAQVGKLAGARALVLGKVADAGDQFIVSARVVDAEAGTVLAAEDAKLPKAELVAFSADAVVLKSRTGAMFRSMVLPGWGQSYNGDEGKGLVLGGLTIGAGISAVAVGALGLHTGFVQYPQAHEDTIVAGASATEVSAHVEAVRGAANTQLTVAAVLGGAFCLAWAVTAADAYISGVDVESLDAALARD